MGSRQFGYPNPGRVGQAIAARKTTLRKVRTPQSTVVGNTHPG